MSDTDRTASPGTEPSASGEPTDVDDAGRLATKPSERRRQVRREIVAGGVTGLRVLATRMDEAGYAASPEQLRADVRALGAVRIEGPDGPVLALPVDGADGPQGDAPKLAAVVSADPDWRLQVGVLVVVALFVLVALLGWLISL